MLVYAERVVIKLTAYAQQAPPGPPDWVSALSVRRLDLCIFTPVLIVLWGLTLGLLAYVQYAEEPHTAALAIVPERIEGNGPIYRIGERAAKVVMTLVVTAMAAPSILKIGSTVARRLSVLLAHRLPRRGAMTIAKILNRSFVERRIAEIRAEGNAEAEAKGEVKGLTKANLLWQEWNRRRMDAEAEGHSFDEPPPA